MIGFLLRRLLLFIPTVIVISIITFMLIQAPPGDYISSYAAQLEASGQEASEQLLTALRRRYGLDQPIYVQYFKWIGGILTRGDFGHSMQWNRPVGDLIWVDQARREEISNDSERCAPLSRARRGNEITLD